VYIIYESAFGRAWPDRACCRVSCSLCDVFLGALFIALGVLPGTINADFLVSSGRTDSVLRYDQATGTFVRAFVPPGRGGLDNPQGLAIGRDGNLYVASFATDSVLRYHGVTGAFLDAFVPNVAGGFGPGALTFGPDGDLFVSDFTAGIVRYDGVTGAFKDVFVPGFLGNTGLLFHSDGKLYVSAFAFDEVRRYDGTTGRFIDSFVTAGSGGLETPAGLSFGPGGDLYVVSQGTSSVLRYDGTTGTFIAAFVPTGSGGLVGPTDLHFGSDGHLYVTGFDNGVLRYDGTTGESIDTFIPAGRGGLGGATYFLRSFGKPCQNPRPNLGLITLNHDDTRLCLANPPANPVMLIGPPSYNGGDPGVVRITRNTAKDYALHFEEWLYLDGSHTNEVVSYLALPEGRYTMPDDSKWEVGTFNASGIGLWWPITFSTPFAGRPYLFLTAQTENGVQPVAVRARNVDSAGFDAALFEEEGLMDGHIPEIVGYLAIYHPYRPVTPEIQGLGGMATIGGKNVPFYAQRLSVDHNFKPAVGASLKVEEEKSVDSETSHVAEEVDVLAIGGHIFAQQVSSFGGDTTALRRNARTEE